MTEWRALLEKHQGRKDLHVIRYFSSFVVISEGRVIDVTEPSLRVCPLAKKFYRKMGLIDATDSQSVKEAVRGVIEGKIKRFGFFTLDRELLKNNIAVLYGASEILMYAMRKQHLDAAVVVCDGAGSVIVDVPEAVQGIGARMNGLFYTSRIPEVVKKLEGAAGHVAFPDARIEQIKAVDRACRLGHQKIAVTVSACMENEHLREIKAIEGKYGVIITVLVVCATGASLQRVREIKEHADLVWSCASQEVRTIIGPDALLQVSEAIPVFVLTQKGLNLLSQYAEPEKVIRDLGARGQHILSSRRSSGERVRMGEGLSNLSPVKLPVRSPREPGPVR